MSNFLEFLEKLAQHCGVKFETKKFKREDEYELAANILNEINKFLYQKKATLPPEYISEFHKYWKENHEKVMLPKVNPNGECSAVAEVLEGIYESNTIKVQLDTLDLTKEEIANVRFFTAIQDFNIDVHARSNPFEFYKRHPDCLNPEKVKDNDLLVDELLNFLGAQSQRDKRKPWMVNSARLLVEKYGSSAFNICDVHNGDVVEIVRALTAEERYGFSTKKAHMFLRDMADLRVWEYKRNIEKLDVMSDKNTMRVALRTGILQFRISLLASFLDVFCYQYSLVDRLNREAWRKVWEEWNKIPNNCRPPTPASMDYLIFRLGKIACRPNKRFCPPEKKVAEKKLESLIPQDRLIFKDDRYCIFSEVCQLDRKILNAPNSISIEGRTGWKSGKTNEGGGGGISS
ncbi:MAG: hypothetical protein COT09_05610 [Candidatus Hydromicrobium americanum]|nr:MAG: hypothetical protein COT09_05610 [Candidatus Hydromicrobium americanum]